MGKNTRWTDDDLRKKGLIETKDGFVKADSLTTPAHKVKKIEPGLNNEIQWRKNEGESAYDGSTLHRLYIDEMAMGFSPVNTKELMEAKKATANRKIIGATKVEIDGVNFDSKLEAYMYQLLKRHKIDFEFQVRYVLQDKFRYGTEAIRQITLTVDFRLAAQNMIIDTKGFQAHDGKLRYKLLKHKLHAEGNIMTIEMPSNKTECEAIIIKLI